MRVKATLHLVDRDPREYGFGWRGIGAAQYRVTVRRLSLTDLSLMERM